MKCLSRNKYILLALLASLFVIADYFFHIAIFRYVIVSSELTVDEVKNVSKSIGSIICPGKTIDGEYQGIVAGSGTYLLLETGEQMRRVVITNEHVAQLHDPDKSYLDNCSVDFAQEGKIQKSDSQGANRIGFSYSSDSVRRGDIVDLAILIPDEINDINDYLNEEEQNTGKPTKDDLLSILESRLLKNNSKSFPICNFRNPIGEKVYVFGYPSSADTAEFPSPTAEYLEKYIMLARFEAYSQYRMGRHMVVTEGIISGKERDNYFTTALIDTGSSGGLAVMKQNNQACLFGIPTWGTIGDLTTLGIIQPFQNIFNSGFDWEKISTNK